ncbi:hypothetical protein [Nonomuraea fuscirosea]|uniref:hypothetical protein n=1 Tax=Nonomuraea fuscirosea TaxID=1291556 RepID=UPI0033D3C790
MAFVLVAFMVAVVVVLTIAAALVLVMVSMVAMILSVSVSVSVVVVVASLGGRVLERLCGRTGGGVRWDGGANERGECHGQEADAWCRGG